MFEDNPSTILDAETGFSKRLKHLPRTHRISRALLSDVIGSIGCMLLYVSSKLPTFTKSFSSGDKFASVGALVGIHASWREVVEGTCLQPVVAGVGDSLLPTACILIPRQMPAPAACGSRDSAGSTRRTEFHVIHSDGDDDADDKETQWFTIARQLVEGFVILEGDDRLRELVEGVGKDPQVSLSSTCFCAVALCRASGRLIEAGQTLASLAIKSEEDYSSRPAICQEFAEPGCFDR